MILILRIINFDFLHHSNGAYFTIEVTPVKNKEANKKKGYIILFFKGSAVFRKNINK
jgi:hypothetical protein